MTGTTHRVSRGRTWPQRVLIGVNVLLVVACLGTAWVLTKVRTALEQVPVVDVGSALSAPVDVEDPRNILIIGTDSHEGLDKSDPVVKGRLKGENLAVITTHDAGSPLNQTGVTPLLVCDLWEHAYYLDHRNDRAAFLSAWWDKLAYWRFAGRQYAAASGESKAWRYPKPVEPALS